MDQLLNIARSGTPESGVQFRSRAYGKDGVRSFLRDVLALANASVEGPRYIVVGVDFDSKGRKTKFAIDAGDFAGKPSYQSLANEFIEPPVRIRYKPVSFDGTRVGVFEIGDCQDRPYMMRIDFDERLRRGDAYKRVNNAAVKMGRRHLMELFERKFRDSVSAGDIEVGFPGEIIHKELSIPTCDLSQMPSALASRKLEEMLRIRNSSPLFRLETADAVNAALAFDNTGAGQVPGLVVWATRIFPIFPALFRKLLAMCQVRRPSSF